jgi:hypothetical protein
MPLIGFAKLALVLLQNKLVVAYDLMKWSALEVMSQPTKGD